MTSPSVFSRLGSARAPCVRCLLAVVLAGSSVAAHAQTTVTWNGANATWAEPDTDSFNAPYNSGDTAVFAGSGTGTVTVSGTVTPAQINVTAGGYTFASGVIGGSAALTKSNAGLLTLIGNNTYSGLTTVSGGTLQIGSGGAVGTLGTGTVELQGTGNIAFNRSDAQTITNTFIWTGSANQLTAGNIVNSGAGTLLLQGNQDARGLQTTSGAGAMTVSSGTLRLGSNGQFTASLNAAAGSSITVNSTLTEVPGGQSFLYKRGLGTVYLGNAVSVSFNGGLVIADGVLDIAGSLEAQLKGRRVVFEGADSNVLQFSGTYAPALSQGAGGVEWSANTNNGGFAARTGAATVNIASGTTLTYQTGSFTRPSFLASGRTLFFGSATADNVVTLQNPINLASGTQTIQVIDNPSSSGDAAVLAGVLSNGGLTKTGAGRLSLAANNTYTGLTTISAGTLSIGAGGTAGAVAGDILNNAALVFDRSDALTFSGTIGGSGGLTKQGAGTLTLGGNGSYAGATAVNVGGLLVDGALSGLGLTSVASGARFGGDGSLAGALSLFSGANFIFNPTATLDVAGAVTLDNNFSVASLVAADGGAIDWASIATGTYTLIGTTSTFNNILNFGVENAANIGAGRTAYFQNGSLQLVIVPEPSALAMLGCVAACGGLLLRRRARRG